MKTRKWMAAACMALACTAYTMAEPDYRFCDRDGNPIEDGSTLLRSETEWADTYGWCIYSGLYIKNMSAEADPETAGGITVTVNGKPYGTVQICAFGACLTDERNNTIVSNKIKADILPPGEQGDIKSEWVMGAAGNTFAPADFTVEYAVKLYAVTQKEVIPGSGVFTEEYTEKADGPKVTVRYKYDGGISGMDSPEGTAAEVVERYDVNGRRLTEPQKGVNIERLSDGTVRKVIVQ